MGDSSLMTWLSVVPILIVVAALAAVLLAWRSGHRKSRLAVGATLLLIGVLGLLGLLGPSSSVGGSLFIGAVGLIILRAAVKDGNGRKDAGDASE